MVGNIFLQVGNFLLQIVAFVQEDGEEGIDIQGETDRDLDHLTGDTLAIFHRTATARLCDATPEGVEKIIVCHTFLLSSGLRLDLHVPWLRSLPESGSA